MEYDFKQIASNIIKGTYECIGTGSGRKVFDFGNGYVIKMARNTRGIAQNAAEYRVASTAASPLLAKISNASEDFEFLIMEKADKLKDISQVWNYFSVKNNIGLTQVKELKDICCKHNLVITDFTRAANWGIINEKPVIIDYGFTSQVRRRFYRIPLFRALRR